MLRMCLLHVRSIFCIKEVEYLKEVDIKESRMCKRRERNNPIAIQIVLDYT